MDRWEKIKMVARECLWSFYCTVLCGYSLADKLILMNFVSKDGRIMRYSMADQHYFFDMFNNLVGPTDETARQIIHWLPQQRLFPFGGSPLLLTNPFMSVADLI